MSRCPTCGRFTGTPGHRCAPAPPTAADSRTTPNASTAGATGSTDPVLPGLEAMLSHVRATAPVEPDAAMEGPGHHASTPPPGYDDLDAAMADGQRPLFLSAAEILARYEPLENDLLEAWEMGRDGEQDETTPEFWARVLDEAASNTRHRGPLGIRPAHGYPSASHASLLEHVGLDGVADPVSLQVDPTRVGRDGRPHILGGHHRLAAAAQSDPDRLMPVAYFRSLTQAKQGLREQY